ncbi:MAG: hypothetical protein GXP03_07030 [Alphaproteobacteria bacterium]|nr:hypothetical protein [Alphaproteobacteria bacterium]
MPKKPNEPTSLNLHRLRNFDHRLLQMEGTLKDISERMLLNEQQFVNEASQRNRQEIRIAEALVQIERINKRLEIVDDSSDNDQ